MGLDVRLSRCCAQLGFAVALVLPACTFAQGYSKSETTVYSDDTSAWVLHNAARRTVNGVEVERTEFTGQMQPGVVYRFGKIDATFSYYSDGTLRTVRDGRGFLTSYAIWKRGIPQRLEHPDGTVESLTVSDAGWVTSTTDAEGFKTCFDHDAMGRVTAVFYPREGARGICDGLDGRVESRNPTRIVFEQLLQESYGIAPKHWRRTEETGALRKTAYYDGMLRTIVEETLDTSNPASTHVWSATRYDGLGRTVFTSYPRNPSGGALLRWSTVADGMSTTYDPLGRPVSILQDSEVGALERTIRYVAPFRRISSDPKGSVTVEAFQAFAEPTYDYPILIDAPEGQRTVIQRDEFGKPTSITRSAR